MKKGREKEEKEKERSGGPHDDVEGQGESEEERGWGTSAINATMAGNSRTESGKRWRVGCAGCRE